MNIESLHRCFRNATLLTGTAALMALGAAMAAPPVESVSRVDLKRFSGQWYEMSHLPHRFQANCVSDTTATYRPQSDGSIEVINRCREGLEQWNVAEGRAVPAKGDASSARLKVSFLPEWLQWLPVGRGDFWVVMLDDDYRYAVISEPSREYLWIMSRTPMMDSATYNSIVAKLRSNGYPVDKLVRTPHQPRPPALASRLMI